MADNEHTEFYFGLYACKACHSSLLLASKQHCDAISTLYCPIVDEDGYTCEQALRPQSAVAIRSYLLAIGHLAEDIRAGKTGSIVLRRDQV